MLGIGGKFAGARGMVQMPNLANLSPTAATAALAAAGLRLGTASEVTSNNSADNEKVFSQSVTAGSLVDYDSDINYSYYRYVPPAIVYTLDSAKIADGSPQTETGCNRTPNLQNASNQYYFCSRTLTSYKYKLLANGVWDGVSYGGYTTEYSTWDCATVINQCGNTRIDSSRSLAFNGEGTCQPNNTKTNLYNYAYLAGNIEYNVPEVVPCTYVNKTPLYTKKAYTTSTCLGGGGCPAGYRLFNTITVFSDGSEETTAENQPECCPCPNTTVRTDNYYFGCEAGFRRCTYRIETYDCTGALVSNIRYDCPSLCCSADVLISQTEWVAVATNVQESAVTYRKCDGTTYTQTETRCSGCSPTWTSSGRCTSGRLSQSRTCFRANCTTFTETRTIAC
jgi:hypothetical protein